MKSPLWFYFLASTVAVSRLHCLGQGSPANVALTNLWQPDGPVHTILESDGVVYLGGRFNYIGPYTGNQVVLDLATGARDTTFPQADGSITDAVSDGAGGWFVAGGFTTIGGIPRAGLAHVLSNKTVDAGWDANISPGSVSRLALAEGTLYLGGLFFSVGGQTRGYIAAVNAANGVVTSWTPNPSIAVSVSVNAFAVSGSTVYVGGTFSSLGGQPRTNLAALNRTDGAATTWNPGANNKVTALVLSGSTLYVGGAFTRIGALFQTNIAALSTATGTPLAWSNNANGTISDLALSGTTLYVSGSFSRIGGATNRASVAALDTATGAALAWNPGVGLVGNTNAGGALTLGMSGASVFIGGSFTSCGGQTRVRIAAVDANTGAALSGWNPGANGVVTLLCVAGNRLFVYGEPPFGFSSLGGAPRNNLAALDAITGAATAWDPGPDFYSEVYSLVPSNNVLFVGGTFDNIGGLRRPRLAALSIASGTAFSWDAHAVSGGVNAMVLTNGTLYVGGAFGVMGNSNRFNLAALNAATANATAWNPGPNGAVETLALSGNTLYAGGTFTSIGGVTRTNIAAVDRLSGSVLPWNPSPNHFAVHTIALDTNRVYVGGAFVRIGGQIRTNVAALDPLSGNALDWDPKVSYSGNRTHVRALLLRDNSVFLGGDFDTVGDLSRFGLAEVDKVTAAATGWMPDTTGGNVQAIALGATKLYVGGASAGGSSVPLFAAYSLQGPERPELTMLALVNGLFQFRLLGTDGQPYVLEVSADLSSWGYLDSVVPLNGLFDYIDTSANGAGQRFYRARIGP